MACLCRTRPSRSRGRQRAAPAAPACMRAAVGRPRRCDTRTGSAARASRAKASARRLARAGDCAAPQTPRTAERGTPPAKLTAMPSRDPGAERRGRLARARLYMVCPERGAARSEDPRELEQLVRAAAAGGVDVVQVREKHLPDEQLAALASALRGPCERAGVLLIVNDRPHVALAAGADGVHVGQDDMPVAEARELVGPDVLIGLSTHAHAEVDARDAAQADYIGVGPVHETPT